MNQPYSSQYLQSSNLGSKQSSSSYLGAPQYSNIYSQSLSSYAQPNQAPQYVNQNTYQSQAPVNAYISSSSYYNQPTNEYAEQVKRSTQSKQSPKQSQVPSYQNISSSQNFGNNLSYSNYGQNENALSSSYGAPYKFTSQFSQSQQIPNVLTNSYSQNVPLQNSNYLQTPERLSQLKGSNVIIHTPHRSPNSCKIVFGSSPSKKQIQEEIEKSSIRALTESQANQKSLSNLKSTIQFISATNSSPEKRQTAKSLINTLYGPQ